MSQASSGSMPNLDVLWQDNPQSWTNASQQAGFIKQLKDLMGDRTDWRLVLDFDPSLSSAVTSGGAWNEDNLVSFLQDMQAAGLTPSQIVYHPDATSALYWLIPETTPPVDGKSASIAPPFNLDVQPVVAKSIANWMATLNAALQKAGLPQSYQLNSIIAEGEYLPKDAEHLTAFRADLTKAGIPTSVPIWYTGDWHQATTITDKSITTSPVQGVYVQLYDYYPEKGEVNPLEPFGPDGKTVIPNPTNPALASTLGAQLLTSLSTPPSGSHLNPDLLQNANNAVFTLNFTGILKDAPVFGAYTTDGGVTANWDLTSTNTLLASLKAEATRELPAGQTTPPDIAIWGIEQALDVLDPQPSSNPTVFSVPDAGNKADFQAAVVHSPLLFVADHGGTLSANFKLQNTGLSGIGLYPILDQQGHIRAADGHLVSPNDPGYGQLAQKLAANYGDWLDKLPQGVSDAAPGSIKPNWTVAQGLSYALVAQEANGHFRTSLDPNASNNPWLSQGIGIDHGSYGIELNGWSATKGADFNEAVVKLDGLNPLKATAASLTLPTIDVLWEDGPAWDKGTADQIAQLIAFSPNGSDYPNQDLNLVVSVIGPNNTKLNATSSAHKGLNFAAVPNNADGLISFIKEINTELSTLTGGKLTWTGSLGYHPDTLTDDFGDWSGWQGQTASGDSFQLASDGAHSYQGYVDYGLYLSNALKAQGLKGFSQLVFETEGSYYHDKNAVPSLEQQLFTTLLPNYAGNKVLLNGQASWSDTMTATASSAPITNWNKATSGWGATNYLAQMYDLAQDPGDYSHTNWPSSYTQLDPSSVTPQVTAQIFANFSANTALSNPILAEYNINRLISNQADMTTPSTAYNPNATIVFSYGPGVYQNHPDPHNPGKILPPDPNGNQPIFQYGVYDTIDGPTTKPTYSWSGDAFAAFVDPNSPTAFPQLLTKNLQQIAAHAQPGVPQSFTNTQDLKLGVWGGERALDAWVGLPAYQNPIDLTAPAIKNLIANSTTNIKDWFTSQPAKGGASADLYVLYDAGSGPNTGRLHVNNGYILQNKVWSLFSGDVPQQTVVAITAENFGQTTYTAPKIIGLHDDLYAGVSSNGQWSGITHTLINT